MASAYQIHRAMEAAETPKALVDVLLAHAGDVTAIESRGYREDISALRQASIVHAERVSGFSFMRLLADALQKLEG